jgi:hypothetical protein
LEARFLCLLSLRRRNYSAVVNRSQALHSAGHDEDA